MFFSCVEPSRKPLKMGIFPRFSSRSYEFLYLFTLKYIFKTYRIVIDYMAEQLLKNRHIQVEDMGENKLWKLVVFCPVPRNGWNIELSITLTPFGILLPNFHMIFNIHKLIHVLNILDMKWILNFLKKISLYSKNQLLGPLWKSQALGGKTLELNVHTFWFLIQGQIWKENCRNLTKFCSFIC